MLTHARTNKSCLKIFYYNLQNKLGSLLLTVFILMHNSKGKVTDFFLLKLSLISQQIFYQKVFHFLRLMAVAAKALWAHRAVMAARTQSELPTLATNIFIINTSNKHRANMPTRMSTKALMDLLGFTRTQLLSMKVGFEYEW